MGPVSDGWTFLTSGDNWGGAGGIVDRSLAHIWISFVAVVISFALAAPLAAWLAHRRLLPVVSVAVANLGRALPSLAIIVLAVPLSISYGFGLGFWPTAIALVVLGIPPIFTNVYEGVASTPAEQIEAARGVGMTARGRFWRVELPAALPLTFTGFRISAVQIVATATLGALAGYECLGTYILEGIASPTVSRGKLVGGAVLVAALAIVVEFVTNLLERGLTPWRRAA